jgi:hypothetical protein
MFKTLSELVLDVHKRLSMAPGTSVQTYAEDHTASLVQEEFDLLAREQGYWWPHLMEWYVSSLDGTTGLCVDVINAAGVDRVEHRDLRFVYHGSNQRPTPILPSTNLNPYTMSTGKRYIEYRNDSSKLFRTWPLTTTGAVYVHIRRLPTEFAAADTVPFDDATLMNKVAWRLATNDGDNVNQGIMFLNNFEAAFQAVKLAYNEPPIDLDPRVQYVNDTWWEPPD